VLNKESGLPYGYNVYQQKDSNRSKKFAIQIERVKSNLIRTISLIISNKYRLVEEFMLLANIAVAKQIYKHYPLKSILRRHPTPNSKQIEQLAEMLKSYGFDFDVTKSSSIQVIN
jgi:exoribonuclease R